MPSLVPGIHGSCKTLTAVRGWPGRARPPTRRCSSRLGLSTSLLLAVEEIRVSGALFGEPRRHCDLSRVQRRNAEIAGENPADFFGTSQRVPLDFSVAMANSKLVVEKGVAATRAG